MWHILRLATMEVKYMSTHEVIVFWELFNEIPSDIKDRDYKFNLRAILVNENGANYCAIQKVWGLILSQQRWSLALPLPKGIVRDISCQTQVVSTEHRLFNIPYLSYQDTEVALVI